MAGYGWVLEPFLVFFDVIAYTERIEYSEGEIAHFEDKAVVVYFVGFSLFEILFYSINFLNLFVVEFDVFKYLAVRFLVYEFELVLFLNSLEDYSVF